jgi:AraC family transcriptional regulator of adaptative response/methylated-DNA-[protein]-cysteine methyltransferase
MLLEKPLNLSGATEADAPSDHAARDYARIERAIAYLLAHHRDQPDLAEIAASVHLSPFHFQRLFTRWAGVSPTQFLRYLTVEHAKGALADSASVLDAALDSGLSGPSRLHDLFVSVEAVSPGEYKAQGAGLELRCGFHRGLFGECLIAASERGVCWLGFTDGGGRKQAMEDLEAAWPGARIVRDDSYADALCQSVFAPAHGDFRRPLKLWFRGTNFQIKVWSALLAIPPGRLVSYGDVAAAIGAPRASRAVGAAVGANPVAWLIPCHRVIGASGLFPARYRYGAARKLAMIGLEAAQADEAAAG